MPYEPSSNSASDLWKQDVTMPRITTPRLVWIVICYSAIVFSAHILQHTMWIYDSRSRIFWASFFGVVQMIWLPALFFINKKKLHLAMSPFLTKCCATILVIVIIIIIGNIRQACYCFFEGLFYGSSFGWVSGYKYYALSSVLYLIFAVILANLLSDIGPARGKEKYEHPDGIVESKVARWTYWSSFVPVYGLLFVLLFGSLAVYRMGKHFESGFSYIKRALISTFSINLLLFALYFLGVFTGWGIINLPKHGKYTSHYTDQSLPGEYYVRYYWFGNEYRVIAYYNNGAKKFDGPIQTPTFREDGNYSGYNAKRGTWFYWDKQGNLIKEECYDSKGELIKTIQHKNENK